MEHILQLRIRQLIRKYKRTLNENDLVFVIVELNDLVLILIFLVGVKNAFSFFGGSLDVVDAELGGDLVVINGPGIMLVLHVDLVARSVDDQGVKAVVFQ